MINPKLMCDQHLLGEHKELHQLAGCIIKGRFNVIRGHVIRSQVQTRSIRSRHLVLVFEMTRRGMNHRSPLPKFTSLDMGEVDIAANLVDLAGRCERCRERMENYNE